MMIKFILLTAITSLTLGGVGIVNTAKAEHNSSYSRDVSYRQHANHAPPPQHDRRYAREHRREYDRHTRREQRGHRNSHFYGGGTYYSSWVGHNRRGYNHHRPHHRADGNVALGIGLGLLTYQIIKNTEPRYQHSYVQQHTQPVAPSTVVYVQRPQAQTSCLQTREYQTVVIIGGVERKAYGTACLQPDGSWLQGPATAEPIFR